MNIVVLGSRVLGLELARELVKSFLGDTFTAGTIGISGGRRSENSRKKSYHLRR
jgi:ribose 5-phosphate isomerase RpiB